jgi:hypothetical protein
LYLGVDVLREFLGERFVAVMGLTWGVLCSKAVTNTAESAKAVALTRSAANFQIYGSRSIKPRPRAIVLLQQPLLT